jgi:hypothetical protein
MFLQLSCYFPLILLLRRQCRLSAAPIAPCVFRRLALMARWADHLRVAQDQAPVWADVDRDDVVYDLRRREVVVLQAFLAQIGVALASEVRQFGPRRVVTPFGGRSPSLVATPRVRAFVFVAERTTDCSGATGEATAGHEAEGHGAGQGVSESM